jgi:hypothetical protein
VFTKQVLYSLSHTSILLCSVILDMGSEELFAKADLELQSSSPDLSLPSSYFPVKQRPMVFLFCVFLPGLGFKLRVSHLLGRQSIT